MLATLAAMQNMNDLDVDRFLGVRSDMSEMMHAMQRYAAEHYFGGEQQEGEGSQDLAQAERSNNWDEHPPLILPSLTEATQSVRAFDLAYESQSQPLNVTTPLPPLSAQSEGPRVGELAPATSRFSTVVGSREREMIVIDLDEDEDDADEEPSDIEETGETEDHGRDRTEEDKYVDAEEDVEEEYVSVSEGEELEPLEDITTYEHPQTEPTSSCLDPDIEPPFVTDGRGRVVWSSGRSGRSVQNNGASGGAGGRSRAWNSKVNGTAVYRKGGGGGTDGIAAADLSEGEAEGRLGEV